MSDNLYLIRVDMERFIGPMNLKQVRDSYRRMEFGLQDEIASSNKAWVAFDDLDRINRLYPELASLIRKEMLSGWGSTEPSPRTLSAHEPIEMARSSKFKKKKLPLVLIFSAVSAAIVFFVTQGKEVDLKYLFQDSMYTQATLLNGKEDKADLANFVTSNRIKINQKLRKKKNFERWIPYIRSVAFGDFGDGTWDGISQKVLRGKNAQFSPTDCSLETWVIRWAQSKFMWSSFLNGQLLPNDAWAKILVWDPVWIRQRRRQPYWLQPSNYYQACIGMAYRAIQKFDDPVYRDQALIIEVRLSNMLAYLANGTAQPLTTPGAGTLGGLNCLELADDEEQLQNCPFVAGTVGDWDILLNQRKNLRFTRLKVANTYILRGENFQDFKDSLTHLVEKGYFTMFDYRDEKKFFQFIVDSEGNIEKALLMMESHNDSLDLSY